MFVIPRYLDPAFLLWCFDVKVRLGGSLARPPSGLLFQKEISRCRCLSTLWLVEQKTTNMAVATQKPIAYPSSRHISRPKISVEPLYMVPLQPPEPAMRRHRVEIV